MDVYYFTEMPYAEFPESEAEKYPSMRLTFPNTYFDPAKAHDLFKRYLDEYQYAEEVGFDGLMINEHHNTPSCMDVEVNISGGILARITSKVKILMLGNMLPTSDNPVRLAEEIAMLDVISGGRIVSGFVRGIGIESWANNTNPVYNRERFEECHDLIIKAWTTPGPFRWEGKHYQYRAVNPWMLPIQKPHPPIHVGGMSAAAHQRAVAHGNGWYGFFLDPDATQAALKGLEEAAKRVERPGELGSLEITITPPGPVDADTARRFEDMGVDRLVVMRSFEDMGPRADAQAKDRVMRFLEDTAVELKLS